MKLTTWTAGILLAASTALGAEFTGKSYELGDPLRMINPHKESIIKRETVDGRKALRIGTPDGKGRMAYFNATHPGMKHGKNPNLTFSFIYLDKGTRPIELVYDSMDPTIFVPGQQPGVWKKAGSVPRTNSGEWRVGSLTVPDARLSRRCNGYDVRIISDVEFVITGLYVSGLPTDKPQELKVDIDHATLSQDLKIEKDHIVNWKKDREVTVDLSTHYGAKGHLLLNYSAVKPFELTYSIPGILEEKTMKMRATGDWNKFGSLKIADLNVPAGQYKLLLKNADQDSFMRLRYVQCTPTMPEPFSREYPELYTEKADSWATAMIAMRKKAAQPHIAATRIHFGKELEMTLNTHDGKKLFAQFPKEMDWFLQDNQVHGDWGHGIYDARQDHGHYLNNKRDNTLEKKLIESVFKELDAPQLKKSYNKLVKKNVSPDDSAWLELYIKACVERRKQRLAPLLAKTDKLVYATHMNMGTIYLATETQRCPDGSQLRIIDLSPEAEGKPLKDELLFDSNNGIVRDPELSFDGKKLLFAWRKTNKGTDSVGKMAPKTGNYKIYEMDLATKKISPLTNDDTYGADFEPCYLPNGNIMFSSVRCVHEVTCGWGDSSNLYVMNKDGKYARRVGFDQTQTGFPHLLNDGRVVYTRRDYNDRGQSYGHGLFVMNPDGTGQTEYYGNNSMAPTSIQHTRPIPGSHKAMGVAGGYHTSQGGKLVVIDNTKGRQNYEGLEFINWTPTPLEEVNDENYCRVGEQYSYPYPLSENSLLISFSPIGAYLTGSNGTLHRRFEDKNMRYKLFYMTLDGKRELLAKHDTLSCTQAIPVMPRKRPAARSSSVDYTKSKGTCYVQNVYYGAGAEGIKPGSVKKLRVIQLHYKPITLGGGGWSPPKKEVGPGRKYAGYGWHSVLPVGVGSASFDAKTILGDVDVHEDGSVMFEVPARTPIYFQLLDEEGKCIQTMRSWTTLMPNENFSCVGCHEDKNSSPISSAKTIALSRPPQKILPAHHFSGKPFSYAKVVQPILDKHCVSCHAPGKKAAKINLTGTLVSDNPHETFASSTRRKFNQSYLTLLQVKKAGARFDEGRPNEWVDYYTRLATTELMPPYYAGSVKSGIMDLLREGHGDTKLSAAEIAAIAAWIDLNVPAVGEYDELNIWDAQSKAKYYEKLNMRHKQEAIERNNILEYISDGQP